MRKEMIETAALEVATQINAVEQSIDGVIAELAELQARMVRARSVSGVGVQTGHEALAKLADALQGMVGARGAIGDCHSALRDAKGRVPGLRTVSWGDGEECPPQATVVDLRIVA